MSEEPREGVFPPPAQSNTSLTPPTPPDTTPQPHTSRPPRAPPPPARGGAAFSHDWDPGRPSCRRSPTGALPEPDPPVLGAGWALRGATSAAGQPRAAGRRG